MYLMLQAEFGVAEQHDPLSRSLDPLLRSTLGLLLQCQEHHRWQRVLYARLAQACATVLPHLRVAHHPIAAVCDLRVVLHHIEDDRAQIARLAIAVRHEE